MLRNAKFNTSGFVGAMVPLENAYSTGLNLHTQFLFGGVHFFEHFWNCRRGVLFCWGRSLFDISGVSYAVLF